MEIKSNKMLKVTGILLIIGGGISLIIAALALVGIAAVAAAVGDDLIELAELAGLAGEYNIGLLMVGMVIVMIGAVISLVAGILGVKNAAKPDKAQICIIFGFLTAVLILAGNILSMGAGGDFNATGLITGLVIPVIYLIGAFNNKKLASQIQI